MRNPFAKPAVLAAALMSVSVALPAQEDNQRSKDKKDMVVVGCLSKMQATSHTESSATTNTPSGTAQTETVQTNKADQFVLTEESTGKKYHLTSSVDLKEHVNHKVRITGKIGSDMQSDRTGNTGGTTGGSGSPSTDSGSTATAHGMGGGQMLKVAQVEHIANTCSAQ